MQNNEINSKNLFDFEFNNRKSFNDFLEWYKNRMSLTFTKEDTLEEVKQFLDDKLSDNGITWFGRTLEIFQKENGR